MQISLIVIRTCMSVLTILLTLHSFQVLYLRSTTAPLSDLLSEKQMRAPFQIDPALLRAAIIRIRSSKYLGAHVWPSFLWCFASFIQTSAYIRKHHMRIHRYSGRAYIALSLYMTQSVLRMATFEKLYGTMEMSLWDPEKFFTFRVATYVFAPYWMFCMAQLYRYAHVKSLALHRLWAWQLMSLGYGVGTMRIVYGLVASYMFPKGGPDFIDAREENRLMGYSLWVSLCVHMLGAGVWWWLCHGRKRAKIA